MGSDRMSRHFLEGAISGRLGFCTNIVFALVFVIVVVLRANVTKNQTFSKFRGNSSKINLAHNLMVGRP